MPRVFLPLTLLVFFCLAASTRANWDKKWDRIQVHAHLVNSGFVEVVERMTAILEGDMDTLERPLSTGPEQAIALRRLVREDVEGEQVLREGDRRERDRYDFTDGVLTWGIRAPGNEWKGETIDFRVEYELRNALSPAWDIPMSQERFGSWGDYWDFPSRMRTAFTAWREAGTRIGKRYRYEHEVRFPPFPATGPRETNYTLKYDSAWRKTFSEREVGSGSDERFRSTMLFDFLPPGKPSDVSVWRPLVRVGSIALVLLAALVLAVVWFISEVRVRGLWRGRIGFAWFAENIAPMQPEALAWFVERPVRWLVTDFLARLRNGGVISVEDVPVAEDADPIVTMRLMNASAPLAPFERAVVSRFFPRGNESGTQVLAEHYKEDGFDPGAAMEDALVEQFSEPAQPEPLVWRTLRSVMPWCFAAGVVLILVCAFSGGHDWRVAMDILVAGFVLAVIPLALGAAKTGWRVALPVFLPIVIALLLWIALFTQQFATNLPLTIWGSAGAALLCLALIMGVFVVLRMRESVPLARRRRDAVLAARYARGQLRRTRPALSDAWMPQLLALGLAPQIARWRERPRDTSMLPGLQPMTLAPFTGTAPRPPGEDWADALTIPARDEPP